MEIEDIITLEDNLEYLILDKTIINNEKYLYCVEIDKEEKPTTNYNYLKEIDVNNELYIEEVKDEKMLEMLINVFTNNYLSDSINTNVEQDD